MLEITKDPHLNKISKQSSLKSLTRMCLKFSIESLIYGLTIFIFSVGNYVDRLMRKHEAIELTFLGEI